MQLRTDGQKYRQIDHFLNISYPTEKKFFLSFIASILSTFFFQFKKELLILYLPFWHCLIKLLFLPCLFIYFPICILLLHVLLSPFRFSSSALSSSFLYLCTASTLSLPLASCLLTHTFFHRLKLYIGILQVLHFCQISSAPS